MNRDFQYNVGGEQKKKEYLITEITTSTPERVPTVPASAGYYWKGSYGWLITIMNQSHEGQGYNSCIVNPPLQPEGHKALFDIQ